MMARYRNALPQLVGDLFLTDAGLETDLIFNHGIEIPEFAAHTLLPDNSGREALGNYYRGFLSLADEMGCGYIMDSQTWKAHSHWAQDLGATADDLEEANRDSISFISALRNEYSSNKGPIVLNAIIGPRGDAYAPEEAVAAKEAEEYHSQQLRWIADTQADMVTAMTFTQADEAIGVVNAAKALDLPVVISFTVETDGNLPTGRTLASAIEVKNRTQPFGYGERRIEERLTLLKAVEQFGGQPGERVTSARLELHRTHADIGTIVTSGSIAGQIARLTATTQTGFVAVTE